MRTVTIRVAGQVSIAIQIYAMGVHAQERLTAPRPPPITPQRYTEEYSYLREPADCSGAWWKHLKFIPLDSQVFPESGSAVHEVD